MTSDQSTSGDRVGDVAASGFAGTSRFRVLRRLGAGGMGVVYEAFDRERDCRVALKTVRDLDGEDLLRLKNEFRALQGLSHPNLVRLEELVEEEGHWFFTMELVEGIGFLHYVRATAPHARGADSGSDGAVSASAATDRPSPARQLWNSAVAGEARFDEGRLRQALGQLTLALSAVHAAGKVHRDIKPSNILVTPSDRVVLLDFGLVTGAAGRDQSLGTGAVGTVHYMAPEQAASQRVGPAADCYSMGILLFEALTGQLPFSGTHLEVMLRKQRTEPPSPRALCPGVPADLDALTVALLHTAPEERPTAAQVLARLGLSGPADGQSTGSLGSHTQAAPFLGREPELHALADAFSTTCRGQAVAVLVEGDSGVGKSALVRRFTDHLEEGVVVLGGRCYEREAVPYKAVDGIIDALSRYMARLPDQEAAALLPRAPALISSVFPVLRRVRVIATAPRPPSKARVDPQELRGRLFAAIRELLSRLADRRRLVLVVDDLQWSDADSLALIGEILRPPDAPAILVVATMRSDAAAMLPAILSHLPEDLRRVDLGRLPPTEARELASHLLARMAPGAAGSAEAIAAEGEGHPLFIEELVRHAAVHGPATWGTLRLDDALRLRVTDLDADARRILELVAVAGRPLPREVVRLAAGLEAKVFSPHVAVLRISHLVQSSGSRDSDTMAPYHDRVREAVAARLSDMERRECHANLAVALEQSERADLELLAVHWRGAGERERAAEYTVKAAAAAEEALAFDRAARLYRTALELGPADGSSARALQVRLADALAKAGRGAEAADAYIQAAKDAPAGESLGLQRLAATQLIKCGRIDEGLAAIHDLARITGVRPARSPRGALLPLVWRRARVALRGYRYRSRDASQVAPEELRRIDYCSWVAAAIAGIDTIRSTDLNSRALLMALRTGEAERLMRTLATEVLLIAGRGTSTERRTQRLLATIRALPCAGTPEGRAWVSWCEGVFLYYLGRFRLALERLRVAEQLFRDECTGVTWEIDGVRLFLLFTLAYLGQIGELSRLAPQLLADARNRGDLYAATNFRLSVHHVAWLVGDDVSGARRVLDEARSGWGAAGSLVHHWFGPLAQAQLDLYQSAGEVAYHGFQASWRPLERSLLLRIELVRVEAYHLRARTALASYQSSEDSSLLRVAQRSSRRVRRERMAPAAPLASLIEAGVAASQGEFEEAISRCAAATAGFEAADMELYAAAARRRHGELLGGDEGRAQIAAADAWMQAERIANPARWVAMLAPGFPD